MFKRCQTPSLPTSRLLLKGRHFRLVGYSFPTQSILIRPSSLLGHVSRWIKSIATIIRVRWLRQIIRIRLLQLRRVQPHQIHTGRRCDLGQIVRAGANIRRPRRSGISRWKVDIIHDIDQNEAANQPQDSSNRTVRHEQDVAQIQMYRDREDPIEPLHEDQGATTKRHSLLESLGIYIGLSMGSSKARLKMRTSIS